jgi:hypothetical protein
MTPANRPSKTGLDQLADEEDTRGQKLLLLLLFFLLLLLLLLSLDWPGWGQKPAQYCVAPTADGDRQQGPIAFAAATASTAAVADDGSAVGSRDRPAPASYSCKPPEKEPK